MNTRERLFREANEHECRAYQAKSKEEAEWHLHKMFELECRAIEMTTDSAADSSRELSEDEPTDSVSADQSRTVLLRPGITNPSLWYPERPPEAEWKRIRKVVMERDNWTCAACGHRAKKWMNTHHLEDSGDHSPENLVPLCVACHAIMHVGLSLSKRVVEVWKSEISQVEIVQRTRKGVKGGLTLAQIKAILPLSLGPYLADSAQYANDLIKGMGTTPRAYLKEPLCAVFVNLTRWQIEDE